MLLVMVLDMSEKEPCELVSLYALKERKSWTASLKILPKFPFLKNMILEREENFDAYSLTT